MKRTNDINPEGKLSGISVIHYKKGRIERFYSLAGQIKWEKEYDLTGKLLRSEEYDENKAKIGTWIKTDENRSVIVYSKPNIVESVTWYSLDGIIETKNHCNSNGEVVKISMYNENGILDELCELRNNKWIVKEFHIDNKTVKLEGPLNYNFVRDGIFFIFNEEGRKIGEEKWEDGYRISVKLDNALKNIKHPKFIKTKLSFEKISKELIKLSSKKASRKGFLSICRLIEEIVLLDLEKFKELILPELKEKLNNWPSKIKMAPLLWINRLILGILPIEALYLVSSLSFSAALGTESCYNSRFYVQLIDWLKKYPKDGPTIEGLSINLSRNTLKRILAEMKNEKLTELHAEIEIKRFNNYIHINDDDYPVIFGSALLSELKVLDLALDETEFELGYTEQGMSFGRGLKLATVMKYLGSKKLEALDLYGQCWSSSNQIADVNTSTKKLKDSLIELKKLNLGGGHPIGDESIKLLVKYAVNLEELYLTPGYSAGQLLSFSESDLYENNEETEYIRSEWDVREFSKIKEMQLTKKAWKDIAKLSLKKIVIGKVQEIKDIDCSAELIVENSWDKSSEGRIASFDNYFEN
jgi:antitoxin component YwqK of YwqJK toxin-antitoxin module